MSARELELVGASVINNGDCMAAVWFALSAVAVGVVGIILARSSDLLGESLRLERSVTGFLLLAAATSLPELVISCQVAREGRVGMAVGSVLGSCLMNLLILAAIDLSRRGSGSMLSYKAAAHALSGLGSILMSALVVVSILVPGMPSLGAISLGSLLVLVAYASSFRLVFLDRKVSRAADAVESDQVETSDKPPRGFRLRPLWLYLGSSAGIFLLSSPLSVSSDQLATQLSLSGTFFGAVFLALVTSLPEIVTTYEASRIEADDMAIGNVLGSNAFNLLILLAIDCVTPEPLFSTLGNVHAIAAIGIVVTTSIAAMGMLYRAEKRWWVFEPDALAVIAVSLTFFYLIYIG
ncbi:MAG: hypothetical protein AAGA03_16770 [Planctomycetota bacterium]